jgi:hypothetical protein
MYPRSFASRENFALAWERLVRGNNREYKSLFRHLYPSYSFSLNHNLDELLHAVRNRSYGPSVSAKVFKPKPSGVLRTLTLLSLNDQVVYQSIANFIAEAFAPVLRRNYLKKSFGALYTGKNNSFFYQPWKQCFRCFNQSIEKAFNRGNTILADFDLVSFYDLIDHRLLRKTLESRISNREVLDLLDRCLSTWTAVRRPGREMAHGIPQGPLPSAFLAECFLHEFDQDNFGSVQYFRYVDDIKLLGKRFSTVRRALVKLDLKAKELGLVPQAQKIEVREVSDIRTELKNVPSPILNLVHGTGGKISAPSTRRLERLFRDSILRKRGRVQVVDPTKFKYLLSRLPRSKRILRTIAPLFRERPDLSGVLGAYSREFPQDGFASEMLFTALKEDPVFDAAASDYVFSLDVCEPSSAPKKYSQLVAKLLRRSSERGALLKHAVNYYQAKRLSVNQALNLVHNLQSQSPFVTGLLLHDLCVDRTRGIFQLAAFRPLLEDGARSANVDHSRFCTYVLLAELGAPPQEVSASGRLVLRAVGLRRGRRAESLVGVFLRDRFGLGASLLWRRALGAAHDAAERRCNQLEGLWEGNPGVLVIALDSFNDFLVQAFSAADPRLCLPFARAAGNNAVPQFGNWLRNGALVRVLPRAAGRFLECHEARLEAELTHARQIRTGRLTRQIKYSETNKIKRRLRQAYVDLVSEWQLLLR